MKNITTVILCVLLLLQLNLSGQGNHSLLQPLKVSDSPMFGNDIPLFPDTSQNQHSVSVCSAFNGWLYAAYGYNTPITNILMVKLLKSIDGGQTWITLSDLSPMIANFEYQYLQLLAIGDSVSNLKLVLGYIEKSILYPTDTYGEIGVYDAITGTAMNDLYHTNSLISLSLASDNNNKPTGANRPTFGALINNNYYSNDSIIFYSSDNLAASFNNRKVLAYSTMKLYTNVSLSYGKSASAGTGCYYVTWGQKINQNTSWGHIFTSHSSPNFNSSFTTPLKVDSIYPALTGIVRNPIICTQSSDYDNDSLDLTSMILMEKYNSSPAGFNLRGLYNKRASSTNHFYSFTLNDTTEYSVQASAVFNPFDSTFVITYYDSTNQKLPFVTNKYNFHNPNTWQIITSGYNDNSNLAAPYPRISLNMEHSEICAWGAQGSNGKKIALVDAPYLYSGVNSENADNKEIDGLIVFPNPCSDFFNVKFNLKYSSDVIITIINSLGMKMVQYPIHHLIAGEHELLFSDLHLFCGSYILNVQTKNSTRSLPLLINN
jgi:hypothetical protein